MFPTDAVQNICDSWWAENNNELKRGALLYAFLPHVDQIPVTLREEGRNDPTSHDRAILNVTPLRIQDHRPKKALPVAALSLDEGELWTAYRAKKRPCLVIGEEPPSVDNALRRDMPKKLTSPTVLVAPYYGVDKDGRRAGYNAPLVERIRHAEYPQFLVDQLPIGGPKESILRFDHIQPIGLNDYAYEHTGYCLSDEAVESILNDWLIWVFYGGLPPESILIDFQNDILSIYGNN
jgi:hypothetical protein